MTEPIIADESEDKSVVENAENTDRNFLLAVALSYFAGSLGVDRFYLGYIGTGVLKLLTFGGLGIWTLIDFLRICLGKMKAKGDKRPLETYGKHAAPFRIIGWALFIVHILSFVVVAMMANWMVQRGIREATDYQTYTQAVQVAEKLNAYIANNNAIPDNLSQVVPDTDTTNLVYFKDSETSYTFCAIYFKDTTKLSIVDDHHPSDAYKDNQKLRISRKHPAGQSCRTITPAQQPASTSDRSTTATLPKTSVEDGCGVPDVVPAFGKPKGRIDQLIGSPQMATFTFEIAEDDSNTTYSVAPEAKVFNASCMPLDRAKVTEGDMVLVFGDPAVISSYTVVGPDVEALVLVDLTAK